MFTLLLFGGYAAFKHFSGTDPLKLDPQSILKNVIAAKSPQEVVNALSSFNINLKNNNPIIPADKNANAQNQNGAVDSQTPTGNPVFKFLILADSENDNTNLRKAIAQAKANYPDIKFIIGLGDYSDVGTVSELKQAKVELDSSGFRYFLVAGDHDFWDSRDKTDDPTINFKQVFGPMYQSFDFQNFKFILIDDSDNYKGISSDQENWITEQLDKAKVDKSLGIFVFMHEPLYHPSSDHFMGRVTKDLKTQAQSLTFQLKQAGVKKVFAADTHYFSEYEEPVTKLPMMTVGALDTDRNPQLPRFGIVSVFSDGSTKVDDVELH